MAAGGRSHRMTKGSSVAVVGIAALVMGLSAQSAPPPAGPQTSAGGDQQPAAQPPVTYSVDVSLVEVDAVVTDREGRVIRDMRRDEFRIFEDGKPQTIDRMSLIEIPIERADARAPAATSPAADVQSNLHRFEGRLY